MNHILVNIYLAGSGIALNNFEVNSKSMGYELIYSTLQIGESPEILDSQRFLDLSEVF